MSEHTGDQLAMIIDQKQQCLQALRELVRQQAQLVATGALGELLKLLSIKQGVLTRLEHVERQLDPFRHQTPEARQWSAPAARQRCAAVTASCAVMLQEILAQEQQCEGQLRLRRDAAAQQLQASHWADAARGAYAAPPHLGTSQLDLASEG